MAEFVNQRALENWLKKTPVDHGDVVVTRAALRVVPLLPIKPEGLLLTRSTLRCLNIAWAASNYPQLDFGTCARISADLAASINAAAARNDAGGAAHNDRYVYADYVARAAADAAIRSAYATIQETQNKPSVSSGVWVHTVATGTADAARAYDASGGNTDDSVNSLWEAVAADRALLDGMTGSGITARELVTRPLWPTSPNEHLHDAWARMKAALSARSEYWMVWIDWYERRLVGDAKGFGLPLDIDEKFVIGLTQEGNEFWERDSALVNADIMARLDAARPVEAIPGSFHFAISKEQIVSSPVRREKSVHEQVVDDMLAALRHCGIAAGGGASTPSSRRMPRRR